MRHQTQTMIISRQQRVGRRLFASRWLIVGLLSILCWSGTLGQAWGGDD